MRVRSLAAAAALCLAGGLASAQIDYSNPHIEIEVTAAQIAAFTGQTEKVDLAALGMDSIGRLYTYTANKRTGTDGPVSQSNDPELVRIDVSGGVPVFTTIANYQQLKGTCDLADATPENAMYFNAIEVGPGTLPIIFATQTRGTDDILVINPGGAPPATTTITRIGQANGIASMFFDNTQTNLAILFSNNVGAGSNDTFTIPANAIGPWPASPLFTQVPIVAHTGAPESGVLTGVHTDAGHYLFWDEGSWQGSDRLLRFTAGGAPPVATELAVAEVGADPTGEGLTAMALGGNQTLFAWNEFPGAPPVQASEGLFLWEDPVKPEGRRTVHDITINAATGLTGNREVATGGIEVRDLNDTQQQIVYLADIGSAAVATDQIISVLYGPGTPTPNGDVNDDGTVNVIDVTELNLYLDGTFAGSPPGDGDADNDGDMDLDDEQDMIDFIVNNVPLPL